jgi:hypothetical protein
MISKKIKNYNRFEFVLSLCFWTSKNSKYKMQSPKINCFKLVSGQFQGQAGGRQEVGVEREVQREGALPESRQDRNVRRS